MRYSIAALKTCAGIILLLATGCLPMDRPVQLSDGSKGYHIYCGGQPNVSEDSCKSRAADMCGDGGYTILKEASPPYPHSEMLWDSSTHDIVVRCNNSK